MNLLTKTTLLFLLVASVVFGVGGMTAYRLILQESTRETEYSLIEQYNQIARSIAAGLPINNLENARVSIQPIAGVPTDTSFHFADTIAFHPLLQREETYRLLSVSRLINDQAYRIKISAIFLELDDIQEIVVDIMTRLFLILGVVLLISSFLISKVLFEPFQRTLDTIRNFDIRSNLVPELPKTTTKEFKQLNNFLATSLEKSHEDYNALKEFSENASHELQTPLAIAKGKLDLLMQSENLGREQLKLIHQTSQSLDRLSRLSESLLLLTKIGNQEFASKESTDFSEVTEQNVGVFSELASLKGLQFNQAITPKVNLPIDSNLAHILIGNLLKNAIRHNIDKGWIKVNLSPQQLRISNSGEAPSMDPNKLFSRFRKSSSGGASLGLGLAIVKKICDVSNFDIDYRFQDGTHSITIDF